MSQVSKINGVPIIDRYVTGATFDDTTLTLQRSGGLSAVTVDLLGLNVESGFLKDSAGTIEVGQVVYAKSWSDADSVPRVELADATTASNTMPAIGLVTVSGSSTVQGQIITNGIHVGFDTSAWSIRDPLYVSTTAGTLTNIRPTGDTKIQTIGRVLSVGGLGSGVIGVYGAGRSNDVPNLEKQKFWLGGDDWVADSVGITDLPTNDTPESSDYILTWDGSASAHTKTIWSAAGGGEANTASNVGGEAGVFKQKTGVDLEFKTLSAGTNIQIFTGDSVVTIAGPAGSGEANTASNLGAGQPVFAQKSGVDLQFRSLVAGTNITITSGATELTINSSGGGGGSSRITGSTQTTNATPAEVDKIDTIPDNATSIIEVYIKAYESGAAEYGVWKRTLTVTKVSGTPVIREENADVDKTSSGLNANSISFAVNSGDIDIDVTGIAATTIDWVSAYEIII